MIRLYSNEHGSTTLIAEVLILSLLALVGFGCVRLLLSHTEKRMNDTSSWVGCSDVLTCQTSEQSSRNK